MITNLELSRRLKADRHQAQNESGNVYRNPRWEFFFRKNCFLIRNRIYNSVVLWIDRPKNRRELEQLTILYDVAKFVLPPSPPFPERTIHCDYLYYRADPVLLTVLGEICPKLPMGHLLAIRENSAVIFLGNSVSRYDSIKLGIANGCCWINDQKHNYFQSCYVSDPNLQSVVAGWLQDAAKFDMVISQYHKLVDAHRPIMNQCPTIFTGH